MARMYMHVMHSIIYSCTVHACQLREAEFQRNQAMFELQKKKEEEERYINLLLLPYAYCINACI